MTERKAEELVSAELTAVQDCLPAELVKLLDPGSILLLRAAILAGISSGIVLAAVNDASYESIALPLAKACRAVSLHNCLLSVTPKGPKI